MWAVKSLCPFHAVKLLPTLTFASSFSSCALTYGHGREGTGEEGREKGGDRRRGGEGEGRETHGLNTLITEISRP